MNKLFDGTRRGFLRAGLTTLATAAATPVFAALPRVKGIRSLAFHNLHTDEKLHVSYWKDGKYDRASCARLDKILRDHYSGDVFPMDLRLFDLLHDVQRKTGHEGTIEVISGYRSPKTNMMLVKSRDGVASHSYHTKGMAIDVRMQGVSLSHLHKVVEKMRRGGVGYYPDSEFVHMDVGPVRRW